MKTTATTTTRKLIAPILATTFLLLGALIPLANPLIANAADTSNFRAGNIISDATFTNTASISAQGVQQFLNSKVPSCDTNGSQPLDAGFSTSGIPDYNGDGTIQRWEWGKKKYNQTTFTCLRNYSQDGKTAARIIYNDAIKYSINPKVLVVLLQKEQGLVTDTWPLNLQYRAATGFGCPDTAACDSQYYGFSNQVKWAAVMFRAIMDDSPNWYSPYVLGNNSIYWSPNHSCGTSTVNILNRATVALYDYTPYRPNQAALNAGYGSGNSCSSYGNRNFWLYYTDWFGSTTSSYDAEVQDVHVYSDSGRTSEINLSNNTYAASPGQTVYVTVGVKNIGPRPLLQGFFRLGTTSPRDHSSSYRDSSWLSSIRAAALTQTSIGTNNTGSFLFSMKIPRDIGQLTEHFGLVAEGRTWISQDSVVLPFNVTPVANYDVTIRSNTLYSNPAMTLNAAVGMADEPILRPGQKLYGKLVFKNIGSQTLPAASTKLGTDSPRDRSDSDFVDSSWLTTIRLAAAPTDITSGATGTITYTLAPTTTEGTFDESFGIVNEGSGWADTEKLDIKITVNAHGPYIESGEELHPGDTMVVGDETLVFQSDRNVVLYKRSHPIWYTHTSNRGGTRLTMQADGNLVLYRVNTPLWDSKTFRKGYSKLILQTDGNLVIYRANGKASWSMRATRL